MMNRSVPSREPRGPDLRALLRTRVLVCDGAVGTLLHAAGVSLDLSLPELCLSRPELVRAVHSAYIAAGAEIIETNSFGASRPRLARHGLEKKTDEINLAAAAVARSAVAAAERPVLIAGSVGPATPPGSHCRPAAETLRAAFTEQIAALYAGGVDLLILETFGRLDELLEAIAAAEAAAPELPVVAQVTFLDDGRTLGGETPAAVGARLDGMNLAAVGANCTLGPQGLLGVLRELGAHTSLPLAAQPNAGPPSFAGGRFHYTADPSYFARQALRLVELGAALVGGCCGTTPAQIEAVAHAARGLRPVRRPAVSRRQAHAGVDLADPPRQPRGRLFERLQRTPFLLAGELPAPAGGGVDQAVRDAAALQAAGCDAVLIGPPSSARAQVSPTSLAVIVQQQLAGLDVILGVASWERSLISLQADLLGAAAFGIGSVLCLAGTPPLLGDYPNIGGIWDVDALRLVQLVLGLNGGHDHHGIPLARPTPFVVGCQVCPNAEDGEREIADARQAIAAGVDFIIAQPVFDLDAVDRLIHAVGVPEGLPVLLGTTLLRDFAHAEYLQHEVPGMAIPQPVLQRMWLARDDGPLVGRQIARELIAAARACGRLRGVVLSAATDATAEIGRVLCDLPAVAPRD